MFVTKADFFLFKYNYGLSTAPTAPPSTAFEVTSPPASSSAPPSSDPPIITESSITDLSSPGGGELSHLAAGGKTVHRRVKLLKGDVEVPGEPPVNQMLGEKFTSLIERIAPLG
ncbi:unnamed protein product [Cuscuta europaea]|uniref:Uncharacterized protein n=1 Tax=Cuscuta europaea TaxID=41803 RepID=A0A9P0ZAX8_CUSEU|nr:unnamed protein product [Cuscuta europaea]